MLSRHADPIIAIATAAGRGAVGIVRVSGRDVSAVMAAVCGQALKARHASYLPFADASGVPIDHGIALYFPGPHSYTGEDVLELQAHGGPVVLQLLLARCLEAGRGTGLRLAEPGEFTQRAFLNDKMDLAQAEAVSDLIDANTEAAARSAGRSLTGAFSHEVHGLRDALVKLRMLVEATLDFPEEDIDFLQKADARGQLDTIATAVAAVLERARQGALLREGMQVVLAGQPNVGKSSLLNALAGAELAIVTPVPGKVSETIQSQGFPVHVTDTAGLRDAHDEVERIGIARSWDAIERADAVLFLHDLTRVGEFSYDVGDDLIAERLLALLPSPDRLVHVFNKRDAAAPPLSGEVAGRHVVISAQTGSGLDRLRTTLLELAGWHAQPEGVFIARARHVTALQRTQAHLHTARSLLASDDPALDLLAEELRLGHDALSEITGQFTPDDLLGEIFSRFCIGK